MAINNLSNFRKNMILSGISRPLSMIISFIYIPVVLNYLGVEKFGIWSTILSILSWISYFDIGIGNGLRNRLTDKISENKKEESKVLVSTAYIFISAIVTVLFIVLSAISYFLDWNKIFGVKSIDENLTLIIIGSLAFLSLNFILSLCKNVIFSLQMASLVSWMELLTQVFNLVLVIIVSQVLHEKLYAMAFIYGLSMVSVNLIMSVYIYKKYRFLRPNLRHFNFGIGKDITNLGIQFFIIQICALILYTTDNLIISSVFGASDVTPYTTTNKLFTVISQFYLALIAPVWSSFTLAKAKKDYLWMKGIINKLYLLMIPFFLGAIVLAIVFEPVTYLWLGQNLDYPKWLIELGAIYCILLVWTSTYAAIGNGLELMKVSVIIAVLQASINIPMSLYFAIGWEMESSGVLLGTIVSMFIPTIVMPIYVKRYINQNNHLSKLQQS